MIFILEELMYKLYAFSTPNSVRVPIALEELDLPYEIEAVNVRKGEQKQPDYLAINPNGKVPALLAAWRRYDVSKGSSLAAIQLM
jgi:GSH-dependent disulfide-bond oxidoreductase